MEIVKHKHPLVLDENFRGGEKDACHLCREPLRSPLIHSVYRCRSSSSGIADEGVDCVNLYLHKSCAELPLEITDYFMHPQHPVFLIPVGSSNSSGSCSICLENLSGIVTYSCQSLTCSDLKVCLKCVTSPRVYHPSHNQHQLTIVQRTASFPCNACDNNYDGDSSSCKCNTCPFWIHMTCALLPSTIKYKFEYDPDVVRRRSDVPIYHRHDLILAYSFPQLYAKFSHKCKICNYSMWETQWVYYCASCRFFIHVRCVDSIETMIHPPKGFVRRNGPSLNLKQIRGNDSELFPEAYHMPAPDESSLNLLRQQFIHQMMSSYEAVKKVLNNRRSHNQDLRIPRGYNGDEDRNWLGESWFTKYSIYSSDKYGTEFQKEEHGKHINILSSGISSDYLFNCHGCGYFKSGINMISDHGKCQLDLGCASLPGEIYHKVHKHSLNREFDYDISDESRCNACGKSFENKIIYRCTFCRRFNLHGTCALKPHKLEHRWDPHPLTLITKPEDVIEDHPHDYNCEHCSKDIDTNYWFYICSLCDLSCHIDCIDEFYKYSSIEFGVSNIKIEQKLHQHGLTLVLNKRKRHCGCCACQIYDAPILECSPCNFIICIRCVNPH